VGPGGMGGGRNIYSEKRGLGANRIPRRRSNNFRGEKQETKGAGPRGTHYVLRPAQRGDVYA